MTTRLRPYALSLAVMLLPTHVSATAFINAQAPTDGRDATAAINSAIDAANAVGGGVVYLPRGTYTIQGDDTPSHVCLEGDGPNATVLQLKDNMADVHLETRPGFFRQGIVFNGLSGARPAFSA